MNNCKNCNTSELQGGRVFRDENGVIIERWCKGCYKEKFTKRLTEKEFKDLVYRVGKLRRSLESTCDSIISVASGTYVGGSDIGGDEDYLPADLVDLRDVFDVLRGIVNRGEIEVMGVVGDE